MIPKGREFYLECAKLSGERNYMIKCALNFKRVLAKDAERLGITKRTAAETAAQ